jgi:hypothetical protein
MDNRVGVGRAFVVGSARYGRRTMGDGQVPFGARDIGWSPHARPLGWLRKDAWEILRQAQDDNGGGTAHQARPFGSSQARPAHPIDGIDQANDRRSQTAATVGPGRNCRPPKNKNCETNPILIKPGLKSETNEANSKRVEPSGLLTMPGYRFGCHQPKRGNLLAGCAGDGARYTVDAGSALTEGVSLVRCARRFPR